MNLSRRTFFLSLLAAITVALMFSSRIPEASTRVPSRLTPSRVFTLVDYFRSGRSAVQDFLQSGAASGTAGTLWPVIRRSQKACAQVEIRFLRTNAAYRSIWGSGVLVDGGRKILTAGHSLPDEDSVEIVIRFHNGEVRTAQLLAHEYRAYGGEGHDWAVMEILGSPVTSVPSVELGEAVEGDLAMVLGYPGQIGINAAGEVAHVSGTGGFLPLVTLSTVLQADPLLLTPTAGSIPVGGMSGGPIFDRQGRVVGIFSSVTRIRRSDGVRYTYNGSILESFPRSEKSR